jgi:hypothetical protein
MPLRFSLIFFNFQCRKNDESEKTFRLLNVAAAEIIDSGIFLSHFDVRIQFFLEMQNLKDIDFSLQEKIFSGIAV